MRSAINGAHPAAAKSLIQTILAIEDAAQQRIDYQVRHRGICLKRCLILRADQYFIGKLATASRALEHSEYQGENFIITQKE